MPKTSQKKLATTREWQRNNREKINAQRRAKRMANLEEWNAKRRAAYAADPAKQEKARTTRNAHYATNRDTINAKRRSDRVANPEKYCAEAHRGYVKHRKARIATQRAYDLVRRDDRLVYQRDYGVKQRATDPEKHRQRGKVYYVTNREKVRIRSHVYYTKKREEILARNRVWRIDNPEKSRAAAARTRARRLAAPINDFTAAQWEEVQEAFSHCCAYCGKRAKGRLTRDHITPLTKGGPHTLSNIVPACASCNSRKNVKPPPKPVQPLLLTLAPAKKPKEKPKP